MSNAAITWAWAVTASATEKVVLVRLADLANGSGECWPSVPRIATDTGLSDRSVQAAITALASRNVLHVTRQTGRLNRFTLAVDATGGDDSNPRSSFTPEAHSPPKEIHPRSTLTPEAASPDPRSTLTPPPNVLHPTPEAASPITLSTPQLTLTEPTLAVRELTVVPDVALNPRRSRIKADWQPSARDREYAAERGISADAEAEGFRNHHLSKGSLMVDWSAAWRTWIGNAKKWSKGTTATKRTGRPSRVGWLVDEMEQRAMGDCGTIIDMENAA